MDAIPVEILAKEVACTLEAAALPGRVEEWRSVLALATSRARVGDAVTLAFTATPGLAATIADLAERERECCTFFAFSIRIAGDQVALEVRAPLEAAALLDAFLEV